MTGTAKKSITHTLKRIVVLRGLVQVLVVACLLPFAMVGLALAYLAYEPSYWFWPSVFVMVFLSPVVWLYRVGWRWAAEAPEEYRNTFRLQLLIVQIICPIAALVLSVLIYQSLREGPPAPGHYPSVFSFRKTG